MAQSRALTAPSAGEDQGAYSLPGGTQEGESGQERVSPNNTLSPQDPEIAILGITQKSHTWSVIDKTLEANKIALREWMHESAVVRPYSGLLFCEKKK